MNRALLYPLLCALFLCTTPLPAQWDDGPGDVPYVPTPPEVVEAMLKLGAVAKGDIVYDLGCGDGRIVIMAAQKYGARGTGFDINPERVREAEENARKAGVTEQVKFGVKNLFEADFYDANLVTLYLLPEVNLRLRPRLLRQLKPGTRVVSHSFSMGEWEPDQKIEIGYRTIYLWTVTDKAKTLYAEKEPTAASVNGEWLFRMPSPNGEMEAQLVLKTEGQQLSGTFTFAENRKLTISDGSVSGNDLKFTVKRDRPSGGVMVYKMTGKVNGSAIAGSTETDMDGQNVTQEWSAKRK